MTLNKAQITAASDALLSARASMTAFDATSHSSQPSELVDVYAIQAAVAAARGPVGGWKVGAPSPQAQATFAPLAHAGICTTGSRLTDDGRRLRGIEVEVAYRLAADLPPKSTPYTLGEVTDAIDAAMAVIEVVESRLLDREKAGAMWMLADNQSHGELIVGQPVSSWQELSLAEIAVRLTFDDDVIVDRACRNAGGQPLDMVVKLANLCGTHCGGLLAGQLVTTGSLMGLVFAPTNALVSATVGDLGSVSLQFGA